MPLDLTAGVRVGVRQPSPPRVTTVAPTAPRVTVVPVRGPQGPPGPSGGASYSHHQINPAATWVIVHNLGLRAVPTVLLDDEPHRPVLTDVDIADANTVTLTFPTPVTGWAHIN